MANEQCIECKACCYPENPEQPFYLNGRYLEPICSGCPNYGTEPPKPQEQIVIHRTGNMRKQEYDLLQQTARRADYLEKRLNELSKPKKKPEQKYGYRGIR